MELKIHTNTPHFQQHTDNQKVCQITFNVKESYVVKILFDSALSVTALNECEFQNSEK